MALFLSQVMNGIGQGVVYASLALALVLIFKTTGILNFAQGEMALVSTYVTWWFTDNGVPVWLSIVLSVVLSFIGGALIERFVMRPVERSSALVIVIVTIGMFLALNSLAQVIFGTEALTVPRAYPNENWEPGGVLIRADTLVLIGVLAAECVFLWFLLQKTKVGLALRAVASNPDSSRLAGVSVGAMLMLGWGLAAAFGAIAGSFVVPTTTALTAASMQSILVFAFAAAALGGFDSPFGAVVGGLIVGVANSLTIEYVDALDGIELIVPFGLILLVLLFRPAGLFGKVHVERVSSPVRLVVTIAAAFAAVFVFAYVLPQQDPSDVRLATEAMYIGIAAMGLNILTGYNGQISIGHGAFFGLGVYTTAILVTDHGWPMLATFPISMALCFAVGAAIGFPALRVKGLYLALVTLGLAVLFPDLTDKFVSGTGGTNLVNVRAAERATPDWYYWFPDPIANFLDEWVKAPDQWAYYLTLVIGLVLLVAVLFMARSRFGRALIAVRDHEAAAETVGIDLARVKVTAFALSALYAGTAGSLSIYVTGLADAKKVETFQLSIEFLVAVVIGGAATVLGPILGAFIVVYLRDRIDNQETLSDLFSDPNRAKLLSPALFGIALILLMYVLPDGIVGGTKRGLRRFTRRRRPSASPLAP